MKIEDINPFVRNAVLGHLTVNTKDLIYNTLATNDCRFFSIISGEGEIVIEGISYKIKENDCILFQSGVRYVWIPDVETGIRYYSVNFDYTQNFTNIKNHFSPFLIDKRQKHAPFENVNFSNACVLNKPLFLKNNAGVCGIIRKIVMEYCIKDEFSDAFLSSLLKSAIIYSVREINRNKTKGVNFPEIRQIIDYIHNHYTEQISNEKIAGHFNFNSSYLGRKFKAAVGVSLRKFLIEYRINVASDFLKTQNLTVCEIATLSGFPDIYHFSKAFKKITGFSPTQYRKKHYVYK